jgi:hypothetical protein
MGDVVNLRRARKAKGRAAKKETAAENRAAFGRPKADAAAQSAEAARAARDHDGKRRTPPRD